MDNKYINHSNGSNDRIITIDIKISRLLKMSEAATLLNMSTSSLQTLMLRGEISSFEVNGQIHFDENELWDWMYKQNPIMIKNKSPQLNIFAN